MKPGVKDLLEYHYAKEAFQNASGRTADCLSLRVLADAPSMKVRLSAAEYAHVAGCAACLHSLALSMRSECPAENFLSAYSDGQSPLAGAIGEHVERQNCRRCREAFSGQLSRAQSLAAAPGNRASATGASIEPTPLKRWPLDWLHRSSRMRGIMAFALTGLVTAALLLSVWFGIDYRRLRSDHARSEFPAPRSGAPQAQVSTPDRKQDQPNTKEKGIASLAFVLSPTTMRGDGEGKRRLLLPSKGIDRVRLNLNFTPYTKYSTYRVILSSIDGAMLLSHDYPGKPGPEGKIPFDVPAASLHDGNYMVVVQGRSGTAAYENVESYFFGVVVRDDLR
jgi:hypothetical protein